ncbi:MAG: MFS transporter [Candidatus Spyradocola sp.]|jgi:predicted MFS family arabinose efflux permease
MSELTQKRVNTVIAIFCLFLFITLALVSLVCYLSFDQNYREIKQSYYAAMCEQVISDMETSISYGKRIDRYYGIEDVFDRTQALFSDEGEFQVATLDLSGDRLYSTYAAGSQEDRIASSDEALLALESVAETGTYQLLNRNGYEMLFMPVQDGEETAGYFVLSYPNSVYTAQRVDMLRAVALYLGIAFAGGLAAILIYSLVIRKRFWDKDTSTRKFLLFGVPSVIIIIFILILGVMNYILFQDRYEAAIREDASSIVEYVRDTTEELHAKGVAYEEMYGLDEYLAKKVEDVPVLWNLRISSIVSDSDTVLDRENDALVSIPMEGAEGTLLVEAFISQEYIDEKMGELFLMFLATFIFCIVIIVEMTKLPAMIDIRSRKDFNEPTEQNYEQISSGVRIASFLRVLSNYMYLPYSAMLIKQWNQAVGGLSVGVTAALPLTMESAGQVIGAMLYPVWFKRPDRRSRLFFVACLGVMIAVNVACFLTGSALTIILMRFIGGLSYSGFMHMLNLIVASGDETEERHQINLAQSNAGIIGGIMCGAGIGAIVAALAGYAFSYIISAAMFLLFGVFVLRMMPWRLLERNAVLKERQVTESEEKFSLLDYVKVVFSPRVLQYFLLVMLPICFGDIYIVTLIPSMADAQGSTILLSYCYIFNGIAGFYFGPKLVELLGKRLGNSLCLVAVMALAAVALVVLGMPPFSVTVLVASTLLGMFDGFGSPMCTDGFLAIPTLKNRMTEVSALAIYFTLSNVISVVAPVIIEVITEGNVSVALVALAGVYIACAVIFAVLSGISSFGKNRRKGATA